MQQIGKYLKNLVARIQTGFQPHDFSLFGIHLAELFQTALYHQGSWTGLHTAMAIVMLSKVINFLKG